MPRRCAGCWAAAATRCRRLHWWRPPGLRPGANPGCRGAGGAGPSALSGPRSAVPLREVYAQWYPDYRQAPPVGPAWTSAPRCGASSTKSGWDTAERWTPWPPGAAGLEGAGHPRGGVRREGPEGIYVAGLRLGQVTDTQDVTGTTLETRPVTADRAALESCCPAFWESRDPPMYSAVKVRRAETL